MRTALSDAPHDVSDGGWTNPRTGALIERAEGRQAAGDHRGAVALLDRAIGMRGVDAGYAMAARTASLFELGRSAEARSQLDLLRKHRPFSPIAFHRAAEAAEASGDQHLALRWFDMALSRCTDQLAQGELIDTEVGTEIALLVFGRRRVRTSLGLPADELDRAAAPNPPKVAYRGTLPPGIATPETLVRVLFWPRDQIVSAAERWPDLVQDIDIESFVRFRELDNRKLTIEDGPSIVMVPITVAQMTEFLSRTGGDPLDPVTRTKLLHERHERDGGIAWPPARNDRCWCGSRNKYKRCCGAIGLA